MPRAQAARHFFRVFSRFRRSFPNFSCLCALTAGVRCVTIWLQRLQRRYSHGRSEKGEGLVYKNHPLRRVDNLIYYGSMADKYVVMLQILDTKKEQDMNVATRVSVQLQLTDPDLRSRDRVVKKSEKDSLYAAMDVGSIWLERALSGKL